MVLAPLQSLDKRKMIHFLDHIIIILYLRQDRRKKLAAARTRQATGQREDVKFHRLGCLNPVGLNDQEHLTKGLGIRSGFLPRRNPEATLWSEMMIQTFLKDRMAIRYPLLGQATCSTTI
jgi:hypothetical protein